MPGFDGSGPLGKGPMTGRGRGFCIMKIKERLAKDPIKNPQGPQKDVPEHLKQQEDLKDGHPFKPMGRLKDREDRTNHKFLKRRS